MLCSLSRVLSYADFFSKSSFSKISFRNSIRVSNSLDPDQARNHVGSRFVKTCADPEGAGGE